MRWLAVPLLLLAVPALAAERSFTIAGEAFSQEEIVDARAQPDTSGGAAILLTFSDGAAARLTALTTRLFDKPAPLVLDGRTLSSPIIAEPVTGGSVTIAGGFTLAEAETLAKVISGKDPLPESLDE